MALTLNKAAISGAMGTTVLEIACDHPQGILAKDAVARLRGDERFADSITRNSSGGYNVIARPVDRKGIWKKDGKLFPSDRNEAPAEL